MVSDDRVYLIDLNASLCLPHIKTTPRKLNKIQEKELRKIEAGLALLHEVPLNQGVCVVDMSRLDQTPPEEVVKTYELLKHHWWPPRPTSWHG